MPNTNSPMTSKLERIKFAEETYGQEALKVLNPQDCEPGLEFEKKTVAQDAGAETRNTRCATDKGMKPLPVNMQKPKPSDAVSIQVGMFDHIPRWKKGSTVNWVAFEAGYNTPEDAILAAKAMRKAADEWNTLDFGVQFKQVDRLEDANFALGYGGQPASRDRVLAEAYFPSDEDISDVIVYALQFTPQYRSQIYNTFLHELGHVLGLRHEHANWNNVFFEGGSVTIGDANSKSVMAYDVDPPMIRPSDKAGIKKFYELEDKQIIGSMRVRLFEPDN